MAGGKPGVHLCQLKLPQVHPDLVMGSKFVKIDEDNPPAVTCYYVLLKVDPKGYIAYWKDVQTGQHETDYIDLYILRDVRSGKLARLPKDSKINDVFSTFGDSLCPIEDKAVTICWGNDFVNLQWATFVAATAEIAKLWCQELFSYAYNLLSVNCSVGIFYERAWTKLFYTQHEGKVAMKNVLRLFALHKDDRDRIVKFLRDAGINVSPNGEFIPADQLVLPRFVEFCCALSFKQDVQQVFEEICSSASSPSPSGHSSNNNTIANVNNSTGSINSSMSLEQLVEFLNGHQRDPRLNELLYPYWTEQRVRPLIERFEPDEELRAKCRLSIGGFIQLLISEENNAAPFDELDLSHEMTHSLSHYYIASSHNTYLTGHQLTGKSSVEMYRQVLLSGCRCVELDCWDGRQPDDEPIIKHGFTMVTEIPLKEALDAINDCAFRTSDFPIILSLENHCSPRQQTKIAQHLRNVFGPALLTEPLPGYPLEPGVPLPPPNLLTRRVLIKNKKVTQATTQNIAVPPNVLPTDKSSASAYRIRADSNSSTCRTMKADTPIITENSSLIHSSTTLDDGISSPVAQTSTVPGDSDPEGDSGDEYSAAQSAAGSSVLSGGLSTATSNLNPHQLSLAASLSSNSLAFPHDSCSTQNQQSNTQNTQQSSSSGGNNNKRRSSKQHSSYTAVKDLSDLVNYIQPVHFISFESAAARNHAFETSSISETTCFNLLKLYPVEFVNYNKRQLSRVYPRGTRVDSHNYLPFLFWVAGCQMVALNYQILDLGMQLYLGCFEFNGRSGYILKPACMVQKSANFSPFLESATDHSVVAATVSVRIISGQYLSPRRVSTYCEVEMFGLPSDSVRKKFRTKLVPNNGMNPVYMSDSFVFTKVVLPRLAILRFVVYDDTNRLVGHRILPVEQLKPGYRFICLRSEANQPIPSASLLVYIKVHDFLADKHRELADALANPIAYLSKLEARAKQLEVLDVDESTEQQSAPVFTPTTASGPSLGSPTGNQPSFSAGSLLAVSSSSNSKALLLATQSNPVISIVPPSSNNQLSVTVPSSVRASSIGNELTVQISEKASSSHRNCRLSSAGLERIHKQRPEELPPVAEIYSSSSCMKLIKKRDQILNLLRRKCTKVDFSDDNAADSAKNEKILGMWRKCYAEQRGVAVKYTELLAASALATLTAMYNDRCKQLAGMFRTEERELRRLLSRERSARLKEITSTSGGLSELSAPSSAVDATGNKEELVRRKRQLQQELIDRAVDEITNMKEASQTMEQRLRRCYEDKQSELEDWRRKMENELEQQYAAVLSNLEKAAASGTLASIHAAERMNQFRSGSGTLAIGGSSDAKHQSLALRASSPDSDHCDNGGSSSDGKGRSSYAGLLALLPPIDEPGSFEDSGERPSGARTSKTSITVGAGAGGGSISPQNQEDDDLIGQSTSLRRSSRSSVSQSLRRLLSCFR